MTRRISRYILLLCLLLICSCDRTLYHSFYSVDDEWLPCDTIRFFVSEPIYSWHECRADVELRCNTQYPYKDLWLHVEARLSNDSIISSDTLCCELFDEYGKQIGTTAGLLYQTEFTFAYLELEGVDTLCINVSHLMNNAVVGVKDVGLRLSACDLHQP